MEINEILDKDPFSVGKEEKRVLLNAYLSELNKYHYQHNSEFKKMMDSLGFDVFGDYQYEEIPFLPVRLFKMFNLISVESNLIIKTMTSSGTSGQAVSRINLDKETSLNQSKTLSKIVTSLLGKQRAPMIILDTESILKDRNLFSARGAGILGFSMFGTKRMYALDKDMNLKVDEIKQFVEKHKRDRILLFGFTFMVYQHFYKEILENDIQLDLSNGVLIHGGGWKKLVNEAISSKEFYKKLNESCGLKHIHDYYGMVEQTGSIYPECECGFLHASTYSDIIIRNPHDFSIAKFGEKGIIQVLSILPKSYPGHSLLTEDEGIIYGEDDCKCGRKGKYFKILGRLPSAEIRGCSDTYASTFK